MKKAKSFGLMFLALAFCLSIFAVNGFAQRYENRRYEDRGWRNRQVYAQQYRYWGNQRYRRLIPQEARRLARQRERLDRMRKVYFANDGRLSYRERRKLQKKYYQYRRDTRRDRRNW